MVALWAVLTVAGVGQVAEPPVRKPSIVGNVVHHRDFESKILGNKRSVWVYLPPDYESERQRRYPVLYLHDGQNVFDGMTSYIPNLEWRADEAAEALIRAKAIAPLIMVAVSNAGIDRGNEYLPTRRKMRDAEVGGSADRYGRFLIEEVKAFVDFTYRTRKGPQDTGLCGSSFGGVVTLHLGLTRPDVFGRLAVVSPSVWWDDRVLIKEVDALPKRLSSRIWIDMGTDEGPGSVAEGALLRDALARKGWQVGKDLVYYVDSGAKHNESAWAGRFDAILLWLYR